MSANKPTNKQRSVRYLLSADRRLQKLSLRKLSERLKKATPQPSPAASKRSAAANQPEAPPRVYSWRAIVVGMTCVLAAAALMTARQPSEDGDAAVAEPPPAAVAPTRAATMAAAPESRKPVVAKPAASATTLVATTAAGTPSADASKSMARIADPASAPVTITGCLQQDGDAFWLKDTSGDGAPKSRSWRTGFLTKRPSRLELVDAGHALKLSSHVGERVAASGTLVDRELRARSVRRVAGACH